MKKILFALLLPIFSMAQQEKVNFTHKLVYENTNNIDFPKYGPINVYLSHSDDALIDMLHSSNFRLYKLLWKDKMFIPIIVSLDETATTAYNFREYFDNMYKSSFALTETGDKDIINGINCNYYETYIYSIKRVCISENNSINMLEALPIENKNIKGLIVKFESNDSNYELKSINKTNLSISINWKKIVNEINEENTLVVNSKAILPDCYEETHAMANSIPPYTEDTEKNDEYKEYDKKLIVSDSVAVASYKYKDEDSNFYVSSYNSEYKTSTTLAVDKLDNSFYYWERLPTYCKELDHKVSDFENSLLKKHARNYAGQICDLYLSEIKRYSVDVKEALDQIRYEENYFRNTVFDHKDQTLLDNFLNELD